MAKRIDTFPNSFGNNGLKSRRGMKAIENKQFYAQTMNSESVYVSDFGDHILTIAI